MNLSFATQVFDLLAPDLDARLADKVPRMVPYVFQCLAVTHRGRLATHGRHVSFKKDLTPAQENRWFNSRAPYTAERVGQLVEALEKPARHRLDALNAAKMNKLFGGAQPIPHPSKLNAECIGSGSAKMARRRERPVAAAVVAQTTLDAAAAEAGQRRRRAC